jgi:PAS domain S-box-containing protein
VCLAVSTIPIGIIGGIEGFQSESLILIGLIFLVTFFVSIAISYFITKPIEKLTENIDKISKGKLDVNLEPGEIFEINNLTDSLNRVMASLKLAIHKVGVKKGEIFEEAVKAKETAEQKHEDLLDSIPGWAWEIDSKGTYTYCSRNVSKLLGYTPKEMIGKTIFDFMILEDVKKAKSVFNEASKNKKPVKDLENWNVKKNSEKVCVITNGVPFFDENGGVLGYRGVDTDISHEKIAEGKISLLNKELADIKMEIIELLNEREKDKGLGTIGIKKKLDEKWSEHEFDSVFLIDENANILDCNENMVKRLGYSKSEMLSLNMADFDALETKEDIKEKINQAKKNGVYSFKTIHKRKDGSAFLVHENLQYLQDKNTFKCIVREDYSLTQSS